MDYKKCPNCDLNYITEDEEICSVCYSPMVTKKSNRPTITNDFTKLVQGLGYGGNSRKIYEKLCDTLGWDKRKADQFGWQTRLYATNCDRERKRDVWFLFYANYDLKNATPQNIDCIEDAHVINFILNNGDTILESIDESYGKSNEADRIVFVKVNGIYEFLGVFTLTENTAGKRQYRRISKEFPYLLG